MYYNDEFLISIRNWMKENPLTEADYLNSEKIIIGTSVSMKGENNPMYGKKHTKEAKLKMSEKSIGRTGFWSGKQLSTTHKRKLSLKKTGLYDGPKNPMYGITRKCSCLYCKKVVDAPNAARWHGIRCKSYPIV